MSIFSKLGRTFKKVGKGIAKAGKGVAKVGKGVVRGVSKVGTGIAQVEKGIAKGTVSLLVKAPRNIVQGKFKRLGGDFASSGRSIGRGIGKVSKGVLQTAQAVEKPFDPVLRPVERQLHKGVEFVKKPLNLLSAANIPLVSQAAGVVNLADQAHHLAPRLVKGKVGVRDFMDLAGNIASVSNIPAAQALGKAANIFGKPIEEIVSGDVKGGLTHGVLAGTSNVLGLDPRYAKFQGAFDLATERLHNET